VYYIEYIEPRPGVSQEDFQRVVTQSTERWAANHPDDELVVSIGRTWRLGPRPPYLTIWKIKDLDTVKRWTEEFRTEKILGEHGEFRAVANIVDAGLYEDLGAEVW
jgi:hypothetical protein